MLARRELEVELEGAAAASVAPARASAAPAPRQSQRRRAGAPDAVRRRVRGRACRWRRSSARGSSTTRQPRRPVAVRIRAQDRDAPGLGGQRERLAAFDDRVVGRPAAAPDQAARLVVAAPHEALDRASPRRSRRRRSARENSGSESQCGKHIQTRSPRGPTMAPRSPSPSSAYSRSDVRRARPRRSAVIAGVRLRRPRLPATAVAAARRSAAVLSATAAGCAASPGRRRGRASRPAGHAARTGCPGGRAATGMSGICCES